jgi:hypothetical protein
MNTANLKWNANTEADLAGYKLYRSTNKGASSLIASPAKGATTYIDELPVMDGTVEYALSAIDTTGNESERTIPVEVVINSNPPMTPTGLTVVLG